jgi:NAD(P)-dependent dehydrogenase (short-subunit alcohol dehydrogenase family)
VDLQLDGRRALVTGGSRGIGKAVARALIAEGARVAIASRTAATVEAAAAELGAVGIVVDTTDDASVRAMVATAVAELGGVDILVNSAAPPASDGPVLAASLTPDDAVRTQVETKVLGYLRCARAVAPLMTAAGWGRIVNISGLNARGSASLVGSVRNVAVAAMTSALADELGPQGVNVTVVHPGITATERTPRLVAERAAAQGVDEAEVERAMGATTSVGRLITGDEVAAVVTFLASPRSVAINGDAIPAGGGQPGVTYY